MKKFIIISLVASLLIPGFASAEFASLYSDTTSQEDYFEAIHYLSERGVINGNPDGTFAPDKCVNRAEILKMLMSVAVVDMLDPLDSQDYNYTDVNNPSEWYYPYVMTATELGYVKGYPDGTFQPGKCVNRVEAIKMALEAFEIELVESNPYIQSLMPISDIETNSWYYNYFETAFLNQLVPLNHVVSDGGEYLPSESMTRKEAADLIARIINYTEGETVSLNGLEFKYPSSYFVMKGEDYASFNVEDEFYLESDAGFLLTNVIVKEESIEAHLKTLSESNVNYQLEDRKDNTVKVTYYEEFGNVNKVQYIKKVGDKIIVVKSNTDSNKFIPLIHSILTTVKIK